MLLLQSLLDLNNFYSFLKTCFKCHLFLEASPLWVREPCALLGPVDCDSVVIMPLISEWMGFLGTLLPCHHIQPGLQVRG